jgi:DNA-binding NtrC family response regulator
LTAENAARAVEVLQEPRRHIAAVLLDVAATQGRPEPVLRRFAELKPELPVFLVRGSKDEETTEACARAGNLAGSLQKPYRAAQLMERLNPFFNT